MTGVIEDATGDLLRFGSVASGAWDDGDYNPATESIRSDVPSPCYRKAQPGATQMSRWTGSEWTLVPQP